jgi:RHS repeat-associated protein
MLRASLVLIGLLLVLAFPVQAAEVFYLHTDHAGSVVMETDQQRNITWQGQYEPYGLPTQTTPEGPGYTGHVHDAGSGLVYMQQRYYDPQVGRFLSVDPLPSGAGPNFNRYSYAANNPHRFIDPDGRDCINKANGMTHCSMKVTGSNIPLTFSFETPEGFSNIESGSARGHHYDIGVSAGTEAEVDASRVRRNAIDNPTPGVDMPATATGQLNDASPSSTLGIAFGSLTESAYSPVRSLIATDHNGNDMVVNVTLPGHPLFPGVVARPVVIENGHVVIRNVGEGMALKQSKWSPVADSLNSIWNSQSQEIVEASR